MKASPHPRSHPPPWLLHVRSLSAGSCRRALTPTTASNSRWADGPTAPGAWRPPSPLSWWLVVLARASHLSHRVSCSCLPLLPLGEAEARERQSQSEERRDSRPPTTQRQREQPAHRTPAAGLADGQCCLVFCFVFVFQNARCVQRALGERKFDARPLRLSCCCRVVDVWLTRMGHSIWLGRVVSTQCRSGRVGRERGKRRVKAAGGGRGG